MQGEFDLKQGAYATQPGLFDSMVVKYRSDLSEFGGQCLGALRHRFPGFVATTYYWKQTYSSQYDAVYGAYKTKSAKNLLCAVYDG